MFDETGQEVGVVQRVVFGPGQDRLEITTGDGASFEVPVRGRAGPGGRPGRRTHRDQLDPGADRTRVSTTRTALN